eukprot:4457216-Pyramimonas_sp.AAC.1
MLHWPRVRLIARKEMEDAGAKVKGPPKKKQEPPKRKNSKKDGFVWWLTSAGMNIGGASG